jgi:2-polyprenyl-3-methyl-5-hydroxy-6-metoxy-1,4-benzoquinol methylase
LLICKKYQSQENTMNMTAEMTMTPEMQTLKTRLKATWMSGDYGTFAKPMEAGALEFLERLAIPAGAKMLDIGCGAGQIAIPAARAGVVVTGVDIASNQIEQARARAQAEGLNVHFEEGDAEMLSYADGSFDVVVSLIGAMFAPRPERVAAEMLRTCRPTGQIVMANWTPTGFVGQMFKIIGKHVPPSPLMPSPLLWGNESTVLERFQTGVTELKLTKRQYPFQYDLEPSEVVEFYRKYYGPTNRAFAALDDAGQAALRRDLEQLWTEHNQATDGTTRYGSEYLEVIATRA